MNKRAIPSAISCLMLGIALTACGQEPASSQTEESAVSESQTAEVQTDEGEVSVEDNVAAEEAEQAEDDDYGGDGRYDSRDDGDDYDRRVFHVMSLVPLVRSCLYIVMVFAAARKTASCGIGERMLVRRSST